MKLIFQVVVLACALGATAQAQPAPQQDPKVEARRLFDQATENYKLGKFKEALTGYEAAYALFKTPPFLFNIAQCHFQLQNWERAIFFFEGYLRDQPNPSNRALVEDLIREAREREGTRREEERRKLDLAKSRLELERQQSDQLARELELQTLSLRPEPAPPVYKKWWFWTIVGGVAVAGVATTVAFTSRDTVLPSGSLPTVDQR